MLNRKYWIQNGREEKFTPEQLQLASQRKEKTIESVWLLFTYFPEILKVNNISKEQVFLLLAGLRIDDFALTHPMQIHTDQTFIHGVWQYTKEQKILKEAQIIFQTYVLPKISDSHEIHFRIARDLGFEIGIWWKYRMAAKKLSA